MQSYKKINNVQNIIDRFDNTKLNEKFINLEHTEHLDNLDFLEYLDYLGHLEYLESLIS